jgi:hypothetical protein
LFFCNRLRFFPKEKWWPGTSIIGFWHSYLPETTTYPTEPNLKNRQLHLMSGPPFFCCFNSSWPHRECELNSRKIRSGLPPGSWTLWTVQCPPFQVCPRVLLILLEANQRPPRSPALSIAFLAPSIGTLKYDKPTKKKKSSAGAWPFLLLHRVSLLLASQGI